jgi:hypothetical protein
MSGFINGVARRETYGALHATPDLCPMVDHYHLDTPPSCSRITYDGQTLMCPYLISLCTPSNASRRLHLSAAIDKNGVLNVARVGILCSAARRNRPPGC